MIFTLEIDDELGARLTDLANGIRMSRSQLIRALLTGALRDEEGIELWRKVVLGPRLEFAPPSLRPRPPRPENAADSVTEEPEDPHAPPTTLAEEWARAGRPIDDDLPIQPDEEPTDEVVDNE